MAKIEEKPEIFDATNPSRTVDEAVQYMVEHMGYRPNTARREVIMERKAKGGRLGDRIVTMPDGTRRTYTI
jgi:hypothetical protein